MKHIDRWQDVKDSAMNTIGKTTGKYPNSEWKFKMLLCEHSPIRLIKLSHTWENLKSWISVHFVRHKFGVEHFVSTQRNDRTGIDRDSMPQDTPVKHTIELNAQAAINISQKRLCRCAHPETVLAWKKTLIEIKKVEPELESVCVPSCVYRGGCPEFFPCGMWDEIVDHSNGSDLQNIKNRYRIYKDFEEKYDW